MTVLFCVLRQLEPRLGPELGCWHQEGPDTGTKPDLVTICWAVTNCVQLSDGTSESPSEKNSSALHYIKWGGKLEIVTRGNQSALIMTRWDIPEDSDRSRTDPGSPDHHGPPLILRDIKVQSLISLNPVAGSRLDLASTWRFVLGLSTLVANQTAEKLRDAQ